MTSSGERCLNVIHITFKMQVSLFDNQITENNKDVALESDQFSCRDSGAGFSRFYKSSCLWFNPLRMVE